MYVVGIVGIIIFYLIVLGVGIWAGIKHKGDSELETMNAGRRLGYVVGTLTLVGTWAGGGYINGAAEKMFTAGLINVQVPIGYSLALVVGMLLFIRRMRDGNYITLLDPLQNKYGLRYGALLILPALTSELFWCGAVLNSLGNALEVVLGLGKVVSIIISAIFAGLYTLVGGLISVTYTDVLQLFFIVFGLVLSAPFAMTNPAVDHDKMNDAELWLGSVEARDAFCYIDNLLLLVLGGIPWQGYFQRVFSIRSTQMAMRMSWFSMVGCFLIAIPSLLLGMAAKVTDWSKTDLGRDYDQDEADMVLPMTLRYLVPPAVTFLGLGAVAGAVMSSADSAILASSAMFSRNVYKNLFRPQASDKEIHCVLRISIVVATGAATAVAIFTESVYYLSFMCSDLVYVILLPQLFLTLYAPKIVNTYGSATAYLFGLTLRIVSGEPGLGVPTVLKFPGYDEELKMQRFPFRTFIMILSHLIFLLVSYIAKVIFTKGHLNLKYDICKQFKPPEEEVENKPA